MFELLIAGGWLIVPLLICSVAIVVISIERYISLRTNKVLPENLLGKVWLWLKERNVTEEKLLELKSTLKMI